MNTLLALLSMWLVPLIIGFLFFAIILFLIRKKDQSSVELEMTSDEISSTTLPVNVASMLSYSLGIISGVTIFLLEKKSRLVSFHATQSLLLFGGLLVIGGMSDIHPVLGFFLGASTTTLGCFLWVYMLIKVYKGKVIVLPLVGRLANNISKNRIKI